MRIKSIVVMLLLPVIHGFSQQKQMPPKLPIDPDTKTIMYREVVTQEGTKDVLFDRGMTWLREYYPNPSSVANVMDKPNGKIEGIGRLRVYYFDEDSTRRDGPMITYMIKMEFKENKYRYTLNDFNLKAASRFPLERWLNKKDPQYSPNCDLYLYQVDTIMQRLTRTLKEGMKPKVIKKDEW
jgi:hypothetical protein